MLGIVVIRLRPGRLWAAAGALLSLTVPLGIALGFAGGLIASGTDAGFWAAVTVPCGVAWVLLGRSLSGYRLPAAR
jgi:hypothetical protein